MNLQDLTNALWALTKLNCAQISSKTRPASTAIILQAVQPHISRLRHEEIAQLMWVASRLKERDVPPGLVSGILESSFPLINSMSYMSLNVLLVGAAVLGVPPPSGWTQRAAEATARTAALRQVRRLPVRQRRAMADRVLQALVALKYIPAGEVGRRVWARQLETHRPVGATSAGGQRQGASETSSLVEPSSSAPLSAGLKGRMAAGSLPPDVWQNLSAAALGAMAYIEWRGGI